MTSAMYDNLLDCLDDSTRETYLRAEGALQEYIQEWLAGEISTVTQFSEVLLVFMLLFTGNVTSFCSLHCHPSKLSAMQAECVKLATLCLESHFEAAKEMVEDGSKIS
jgi:hypothetical protein